MGGDSTFRPAYFRPVKIDLPGSKSAPIGFSIRLSIGFSMGSKAATARADPIRFHPIPSDPIRSDPIRSGLSRPCPARQGGERREGVCRGGGHHAQAGHNSRGSRGKSSPAAQSSPPVQPCSPAQQPSPASQSSPAVQTSPPDQHSSPVLHPVQPPRLQDWTRGLDWRTGLGCWTQPSRPFLQSSIPAQSSPSHRDPVHRRHAPPLRSTVWLSVESRFLHSARSRTPCASCSSMMG